MSEKFKVEFLEEVFEFLDSLDEKARKKFFSILIGQKSYRTTLYLKS